MTTNRRKQKATAIRDNRMRRPKSNPHLKLSISVAIVSSSLLEELLGIPYPAWGFRLGWVTGGVNIGDASTERLGNSTPERCHSYNPKPWIIHRSLLFMNKHANIFFNAKEMNTMEGNQDSSRRQSIFQVSVYHKRRNTIEINLQCVLLISKVHITDDIAHKLSPTLNSTMLWIIKWSCFWLTNKTAH